ncbi:hypothetical protein CAEBREN_02020 [Caenorhabditis brenneri]|uniref:Uncharacterized protein n=1 Tax=Caenorhabditis brenneri TaxID=135651 RepID=G0MMB1_CAEBE|nr:hypothetical protein CAEBREN_02020 [Caenorhabditis brenneri]
MLPKNRQLSTYLSTVNELGSTEDTGTTTEGMEKRSINFKSLQQLNGHHPYIDDIDDDPPIKSTDTRPAPHWLDGPRDATALPDIIASTYSDYSDEADYAMKQMLAVLETLNPAEDNMELFESALKAIEFRLPFDMILDDDEKPDWQAIRLRLIANSISLVPSASDSEHRRGLSSAQMSAVFDAIPFLFDAVACNHELQDYQNVLSMIVIIAMTGNSMKSARQVLQQFENSEILPT